MKIKSKMLLSVVSSALLFSSVSAFADSQVGVLICNVLNSYGVVTKKGNLSTHINPKNDIQLYPLQHDISYTLTPGDATNAYSQSKLGGTVTWQPQYDGKTSDPYTDCSYASYSSKLPYPLTSQLTITDLNTGVVIWQGSLTTYPETLSANPRSVNFYSDIKSVSKDLSDPIFFFTTPNQISVQRY